MFLITHFAVIHLLFFLALQVLCAPAFVFLLHVRFLPDLLNLFLPVHQYRLLLTGSKIEPKLIDIFSKLVIPFIFSLKEMASVPWFM